MSDLSQMLGSPLGRSTPVEAEVQRQLTGDLGTLTTQLGRLLDDSAEVLRGMLGVRPDLPPRRGHAWTLLTEFESPLWPMLALSRPPTLPPLGTARVARHLMTAHLAMDLERCREWARTPETREATEALLLELSGPDGAAPEGPEAPASGQGEPTWGTLLGAVSTIQTHHLMLHSWGVLSAYVGLSTGLRLEAARTLCAALRRDPGLCRRPQDFATQTLWANLSLLHGGLPCPDSAQVTALAQAMRTLPERTTLSPLPGLPDLGQHLAQIVPGLDGVARRELAERLSGVRPTDPSLMTTGLLALRQPGEGAFWLRRAGEVQLIVSRCPDPQAALEVRAWRWRLPARLSGGWAI